MNPICCCETDPALDRPIIVLPRCTIFQCNVCGLWYIDYLLGEVSAQILLQSHQSESYYSSFPLNYLDALPSKTQSLVFGKAVAAALSLRPMAARLLDVGCGGGQFLRFVEQIRSRRLPSTIGLEVSPYFAQMVRGRGLKVVRDDIQFASFRHGCFDIVCMWDVLEHLGRPLVALLEANRILSLGGVLVLSTPNAASLLHVLALLKHRFPIGLLKKPARRILAGHPLYFSYACLEHLLLRSGFVLRGGFQHSVASEMSFRGGLMETTAALLDASLGRTFGSRYRMVAIAQKRA